jgi:hypothetical protein
MKISTIVKIAAGLGFAAVVAPLDGGLSLAKVTGGSSAAALAKFGLCAGVGYGAAKAVLTPELEATIKTAADSAAESAIMSYQDMMDKVTTRRNAEGQFVAKEATA